jgi:hypothetical protein
MSLLKLSDKYSTERLEAACAKALMYTPRPNYKSISVILSSSQDKLQSAETSKQKTSTQGFVRGADYFKGGADDVE